MFVGLEGTSMAELKTTPRDGRRLSSVSADELTAIQGEFAGLDKDGDKEVSIKELRDLLNSMKVQLVLTDGQIDRVIKQIDKDDDGVVEIEEFNEIIEKFDKNGVIYKALSERSKIREDFKKYDEDESGFITIDELNNIVSERMGITISEKHIQRMMKDIDSNGDGKIDYEEFCILMTKSFMKKRILSRNPKTRVEDVKNDVKG